MNHKRSNFILAVVFLLLLNLTSCHSASGNDLEDTARSFTIAILSEEKSYDSWQEMGYTRGSSWPIFLDAYQSSQDAYRIETNDIDVYDWSEQTITLTAKASEAMINTFECIPDDRFPCAGMSVFVVVVDQSPAYGGLIMDPYSPLGFQFPVIYPTIRGDRMIFAIRPVHHHKSASGFDESYWFDLDESYWAGIMDQRVKALFDRLGKLGDSINR